MIIRDNRSPVEILAESFDSFYRDVISPHDPTGSGFDSAQLVFYSGAVAAIAALPVDSVQAIADALAELYRVAKAITTDASDKVAAKSDPRFSKPRLQ